MSSKLCCLVSMVFFFLSISRSMSTDDGTQARINYVCQQTYDFFVCRDIFNKNLYTNVTDFKGLTQISLAQTLIYASDTLIFIQKSERNETHNTTQRDLYKICDEGYGLLLNQFEDASFAFARGDFRSMLFDTSRCERFVDDCESVLGFKVPALKSKNFRTKILVRMANISGGLIGTEKT